MQAVLAQLFSQTDLCGIWRVTAPCSPGTQNTASVEWGPGQKALQQVQAPVHAALRSGPFEAAGPGVLGGASDRPRQGNHSTGPCNLGARPRHPLQVITVLWTDSSWLYQVLAETECLSRGH